MCGVATITPTLVRSATNRIAPSALRSFAAMGGVRLGSDPMPSAVDPRVEIQASLERASNYNRWIGDQARRHLGRRVLDAGCGSGNITEQFLDRDQVVAVDVWEDFVEAM